MMEQPPAQFDIDPIGGVAQRIGAQELKDGLEQAERNHADDQHDKRNYPPRCHERRSLNPWVDGPH